MRNIVKKIRINIFVYLGIFIFFLNIPGAFAADQIVNLVVAYKTVNFTGHFVKAIAVNNQIPAPTLHFKEGDRVTINVYNHLDKGTAIHWHGLLVPWQMDGVEGISQKAIPPGGVFHYQFTLHQAGTYWYHAHAGLQEQQGLYGALLIDPKKAPRYHYTKDYAIVLSDWSNTNPDKIFANLKKEGDYYSPRFPLQPSLVKFIHDYRKATPEERTQLIDDYKMMQQMRMSIYDISDVAYDAFLLNGQSNAYPWTAPVQVGDVVRLRFIGASSSTNFHVKVVGAPMQVVQVEGNDVKPFTVNDFFITPGETEDVLVKIQKDEPLIIYAESADTLGAAYGALVTHSQQPVNYKSVVPFPEPRPVTQEMMNNMMSGTNQKSMTGDTQTMANMNRSSDSMDPNMSAMNMPHTMPMDNRMLMKHSHSMDMSTEATITGDVLSSNTEIFSHLTTTGTKYQNLIAAVKTNDPNKPVQIIRMELFGYMDHFIWMINGLPEYKAHPILLEPEKRYRIIFTNESMMHHPMHIHGHWFILRNGHGAYDPLLHTIDVPPGATVVADVDADASGQWFFHCHHLYHMMAGMARVFQYTTIINIEKGTAAPQSTVIQTPYINRPIVREDEAMPLDPALITHPMAHSPVFFLASFLDVGEDPFDNVQEVTYKGLYGPDYNKLELFTNDAEMNQGTVEYADMDIFYWHLLSQFWAIKGGANYFYRPSGTPYWQPGIGLEGLTPYFIDTDIRTYYHDGSEKLDAELSRDIQITNNGLIRLDIRSILATKTVTDDEIGSGLNQMRYIIRPYYRLMPGLNIFTQFERDEDYGVFKTLRRNAGEATSENVLIFGVSVLF